jgi:hypothetical protein
VAPADGGSAVTSYNLEWDQGTAFGVDLVGVASPYLGRTFALTSGLVAGGTYRFRYRVANAYGWSPPSDAVSIQAADIPAQPSPVTAQVTDIYVRFQWSAPNDRSSPIAGYELVIGASGGTDFIEETTYCDGSLPAVVASRYCLVPMTTLRAPLYSLVYADRVVARIRALNSVGWSPYSDANPDGALVQTEPRTASTPAPARGPRTDHTRVEVEWAPMASAAATGGSAITSYNLQWDRGDGTAAYVDLVGQAGSAYSSTSYLLVAGVVSGRTYQFRLRAQNKWGFGGYSAVVGIQASTTPGRASAPTTAISGSSVRITWSKPDEHGSAITAYRIVVQTATLDYLEDTDHCDGRLPEIVLARACEIPLATLRAAPFSLVFN